jgi:hypothetical protein
MNDLQVILSPFTRCEPGYALKRAAKIRRFGEPGELGYLGNRVAGIFDNESFGMFNP